MALNISKTTVTNDVRAGTVIGILTATQGNWVIPCIYSLETNSNNYFAISGNNLVTSQNDAMVVGQYSVKVGATPISLSAYNTFTITVTDPPSSPPAGTVAC